MMLAYCQNVITRMAGFGTGEAFLDWAENGNGQCMAHYLRSLMADSLC